MNNNTPVTFSDVRFGSLRIVGDLFIAQDAANVLGYANTRDAILRHVDEADRADVVIFDGSQNRTMTGINESGLYSLIIGSCLPAAREFKRWVTSDVLPAIRQHGMYATPEVIEASLRDPDYIIAILNNIKDQRAVIDNQRGQIAVMEPKADFYDAVANCKEAISVGDVARLLGYAGLGQNNLFKSLKTMKILKPDGIPYQEYIDRGYFKVIEQKYIARGEQQIHFKTLVYQKGIDYIRKRINN